MTEELNLLRYSHSEQVKINQKIFISLPKVVKFPLTLISCHVIVNLTSIGDCYSIHIVKLLWDGERK